MIQHEEGCKYRRCDCGVDYEHAATILAEIEKLQRLLQRASDEWVPHYTLLSSEIKDALRELQGAMRE
jgi:hypothetical protein